jgi:hypothetical protein
MKKPDLVRRQAALKKTIDKYRDKPFVWGRCDCWAMFRSHMVAMGHKGLPTPPKYANALGAKRALKAMGFDTVEALLDSILPRIAPAQALPGDAVMVDGSESLDCITISVGLKAFGWHEDAEGATVLIHRQVKGAWRG